MTVIGVIENEGKQLGDGPNAFREILAEFGHRDPPWITVSKSKHAPEHVRRLVDEHGVDRIIMWGGDGTVRRCIHTLIADAIAGVSVGVMPAGTANLLAANLQIPTDLRRAAEIAIAGDPRPIDIGRINGQHFAVMAGTGFDALMIRDADDDGLKERFGRLGYVWAGITNTGIEPVRAEIDVDGRPWFVGDTSGVTVGNVSAILGGLEAFPDTTPTDGRLGVGVIEAHTKLEWLRLVGRAAVGRADRSPFVSMTQAAAITIELDRSLPWEVDGGDRDRADHFEIVCLPKAISIVQPRH